MKVSLNWLAQYVPLEMEAVQLAEALTMVGLEVEAVSDRYEYLDRVRVGRIVDITPHPNTDKLMCCRIDTGNRQLSVVCGAPNIQKQMLVAAALPGTVLPFQAPLEESAIYGIPSEGMLCSAAELGLGDDRTGVMALDSSLPVGETLSRALNLTDVVFEIGLTPNRPDCLSIIGIAREVAAIQKTKLTPPEIKLPKTPGPISDLTSVTIQAPLLCPRYAARLLERIKVGPSPFWLQDRLISVGLRPINNIVDITNFVMLEMGQPLHAFDFDRLGGHKIVVRTAAEGEAFYTLDQKERRLSEDMLMICDAEKPVALAGVMGGLNSEIRPDTHRVLIESACFQPVSIRRTSKRLGLGTDASHRFERGVDPEGTVAALDRAAELMVETGAGHLIGGLIDEHPGKMPVRKISLTAHDTNRLLGTAFQLSEIKAHLESIEFAVETENRDTLVVSPPSFRVDIERPVDLMEEIARLSGYQNIPTTFPLMSTEAREAFRPLRLRNRIKQMLAGIGFTETINYSFINHNACDRLQIEPGDPRRAMLGIVNPLSEDQTVMRTSLIPGLLDTVRHNVAQQNHDLKLFEIGKVYISNGQEDLPAEIEMLAGLWTGSRFNSSWHTDPVECDFYDPKGAVEGLLDNLEIADVKFTRPDENACRYARPGHTAQIFAGNRRLGVIGEVHPAVRRHFDLKPAVFIFELNLDDLLAHVPEVKSFRPIPKFPATSRDMTVIVDKRLEAGSLIEKINAVDEALVENIHLFAVYEGAPIPPGKKSISVRLTYRSAQETLEDDVINRLHKNITDQIVKQLDATLPT